MAATTIDVPESQRLIAVSLGKIAASRGQKGGINLHKNLLVATVLTKARAAYMIQHMNAVKQQQRAAAMPVTTTTTSLPSSSSSSSTCVEMTEAKPEQPSGSLSATSPATSSSSSPSSVAAAATPTALHSSPAAAHTPAAPRSVTPLPETASVPEGAAGSRMQVAEENEDKENTPPPPSSPCRDAPSSPSSSLDCEKRLHGEPCADVVKEGKPALSSRPVVVTGVSHGQQSNSSSNNTRDYVSRPSSTCCLLKRRRAMDRDHENVSAPKVRILEAKVSDSTTTTPTTTTTTTTSTPEPMQCDSPQISNLVNIFNTGFSGLSGAGGSGCAGDLSVRSVVGQSMILTTVSGHKLSDNLTCAKEMSKVGLDSLHHPLVLSV